MSVPNIVPIVRYSGTGEQKEFYIPFPYLDKADLVVRSSLNGAMSEADYEVNGKYITFVNAPADKEVIAILRKTAIERIADYDDTGAVSASSLNDNFDRPLLSMQEIAEVLERCVKVDPTSYVDPQEYFEQNIKITENSKDVALNAAVSAANSAQTAATSERNIGLIWAKITGDPTLAENALITLKEAAEATGAITAAKELAVGEIRNTGAIAVAATEKAADEAREAADIAANTAGSISQTVADQITIQVSQAAGANGILGVAIETGKNVVASARQEAYDKAQEALNKINAGNREFTDQSNAAIIQIQGKVDSVAIDVQTAIEKAQIIAGNYLKNAQATVSGSIADLEQMKQQAGSDTELIALINKRIAELQELQGYLTDAESAKTAAENFSQAASSSAGNASASASSAGSSASNAASKAAEALQSAQSAATSASNAAASAVAASTTATEVSNQLLTVHNASTEAHPALRRGQITNPINLTSGTDLNDLKNPGFYQVVSDSIAKTILNSPVTTAFALELYGSKGMCYQRITKYNDAAVFVRNYYDYSDRWTEWKELAITDDLGAYLPLAGGQMSGNINCTSDAARFIIAGATDYSKGAHLTLNGQDGSLYPGCFEINARSKTSSRILIGKPDGSLLWNNEPVQNPKGTVIAFAGNSAPAGYLICNGAAVSRTTYAGLFAVIGTTYGAGDGSTTFNLPNLTDKFIQGSGTAGTVKAAGLPNITGHAPLHTNANVHADYNYTGSALYRTNKSKGYYEASEGRTGDITYFDASRSNSIYGNSDTVQPPAVTMRYYIKY